MQLNNLDVKSLLKETGFEALELPSLFKIASWPDWLDVRGDFDLGTSETRKYQRVVTGEVGFKIGEASFQRQKSGESFYFFVNRDGSFGFGWSFVYYHWEPRIGFHTYNSTSQEPAERLTALLFFAQNKEEIMDIIKAKMLETESENNQVTEIFKKIALPSYAD